MSAEISSFFSVEPPSFQKIHRSLLKRQSELYAQVITAQDWADYRYRVGRLQGVTDALDILNDINKIKERNEWQEPS